MSNTWKIILGAVTLVLIAFCFLLIIKNYVNDPDTQSILLTVGSIVFSILLLLVALMIMTMLFASKSLNANDQPLALPSGSVRAIIALMLIVIFVVGSVFLYRNLAQAYHSIATLQAVTSDQLKQIPITDMLSEKLNPDNTTYTVVLMVRNSAASDDFAKQLLTVMSTLVVSISSFYFGSRISEAANAANKAPTPVLEDTDPKVAKLKADIRDFKILGKGLQLVNYVRLEKGNLKIIGDSPTSDENTIIVPKITIGAEPEAIGAWNIIVTTSDNKEARLDGKFTVSQP